MAKAQQYILDIIKTNWLQATTKLFFTNHTLLELSKVASISLEDDYLIDNLPIPALQGKTIAELTTQLKNGINTYSFIIDVQQCCISNLKHYSNTEDTDCNLQIGMLDVLQIKIKAYELQATYQHWKNTQIYYQFKGSCFASKEKIIKAKIAYKLQFANFITWYKNIIDSPNLMINDKGLSNIATEQLGTTIDGIITQYLNSDYHIYSYLYSLEESQNIEDKFLEIQNQEDSKFDQPTQLLNHQEEASALVYYLMQQMQENENARFERKKIRQDKPDQVENDLHFLYFYIFRHYSFDTFRNLTRESNVDAVERRNEIQIKKTEFDHLSLAQKNELKIQHDREIITIMRDFQCTEVVCKQKKFSLEVDESVLQNIWNSLKPISTQAILADLKTGIANFSKLREKESSALDELPLLKLKTQICQQHFYNSTLFYSLSKVHYWFLEERSQEISKMDRTKYTMSNYLRQHLETDIHSELESLKIEFKINISDSFNQLYQAHQKLIAKGAELGVIHDETDTDYHSWIDSIDYTHTQTKENDCIIC